MTGTASSRCRFFLDSDTARNQEWLRRRKLRLEQVRKQSSEIAKALREKVTNADKARLDEYERIGQAKLREWKAEKLQKLEEQLQCALEEFGESYKLAEAEPYPEDIIEERYKINLEKAQKRGEIAIQEELKRKKIEEEKKLSPILRKKLVRKKEDLRSALVHSLPLKKQLMNAQEVCEEKDHPKLISEKFIPVSQSKEKILHSKDTNVIDSKKKIHINKPKKKKVQPRRSCLCKHKKTSEVSHPRQNEMIWINLNEIQNSSAGDSGMRARSTKSFENIEKEQKEKSEKIVQFYDFSSRYYCKSYKEFPHLVERIEPESEMPDANELAEVEDENEKKETKKKAAIKAVTQERGIEALKREKINQEYNNLFARVEELSKKEKVLKAQQRHRSDILHMNDERLSEKLKSRQQIMNSKFESICYEALSQIPRTQSPTQEVFSRRGGGDCPESKEKTSARLSFSPASSCPKPNSPVTSEEKPTENLSLQGPSRKPKKTKKKRQLLLDIDKALKEGRELRKTINRNLSCSDGENEMVKQPSSSEMRTKSAETSPKEEKETRTQESQTEDLKVEFEQEDLKLFEKTEDESLPLSTSTTYKSPPNVIRSYRLRQFLDYLEGVSEPPDNNLTQSETKFHRKIKKILRDLVYNPKKNSEENEKESNRNPTLEYYIEKLLSMSRECIADLSVSSENMSTPNITDLDAKKESDAKIQYDVSPKGEKLIRKSRLERADMLQETIDNWKRILGRKTQSDAEDEPDGSCPVPVESVSETREEAVDDLSRPDINNKYEEITKKCSERISELSNMLNKVRKDKEKLLHSTSGDSSLSMREDDRNTEKELGEEGDEDVAPLRNVMSPENFKSSILDDFINRYNISKPMNETESTIAVADSQSLPDFEESLESWPDVMDELIKRKILTSPFKWSDGEFSSGITTVNGSQTKLSSIETVIGNFRKEINKIKPFTVSAPFDPSTTTHLKSRHFVDGKHIKQESFCSPPRNISSRPNNEKHVWEESSVDSINHALSSLGLNWAKSFLRKNEESRAMSSSSNSGGKSSDYESDYT